MPLSTLQFNLTDYPPFSVLYFCAAAAYHRVMELSQPTSILVERLRAVGLRPTRQRLALTRLLFAKGDRHVTAEQLHGEVLASAIPVSLATVYNTPTQGCCARSWSSRGDPISTPTSPIIIISSASRTGCCKTSRPRS